MKTILAPIDFSRVTPWVVAEAADLARRLNGYLILLNVTKPYTRRNNQAAFLKTMQKLVEHRLKAVAARGQGKRPSAGDPDLVSGDSIQLIGDPVPTILEQAKKLSADFVVMGSHGRSALHDLVFGSVAAGVLKHAQCPVIIVPSRRNRVGVKRRKLLVRKLFSQRGKKLGRRKADRVIDRRSKSALAR